MKQKIVGWRQDEAGDWVAVLACGHGQHVRHEPPLRFRAWVLTAAGRQGFLGFELDCKRCDAGEPPLPPTGKAEEGLGEGPDLLA